MEVQILKEQEITDNKAVCIWNQNNAVYWRNLKAQVQQNALK